MKVLLSGGGSAGHVNPAIAIADLIRSKDPGAEIAFVGTSKGIENTLVTRALYPIYHIEMTGLVRGLSPKNIKTAYYTLTAPRKAKKLLLSYRPDIVIGTGGYVCWPLLSAAAALGIPTAVHESNAIPGKAVRMLEKKVDRVYLNFASAADELTHKEKALAVGNPLSPKSTQRMPVDVKERLEIPQNTQKIVLSFGGSLGSAPLNSLLLHLMEVYSARHPEVYHIHAAGRNHFESAKAEFEAKGLSRYPNLKLVEYLFDMPYWERLADLVICRAGAMTVSEMALQKKPCILIPSPYVPNNHQYKNAKTLSDVGAAILFDEKEDDKERLVRETDRILTDRDVSGSLSRAISAFAVPDTNERIWRDIKALTEKKSRDDSTAQ